MYIKKKNFKNKDGSERVYAQICESKRINGKPKQFVLLDFGRIDTEEGEIKFNTFCSLVLKQSSKYHFLDLGKDLSSKNTQELGTQLIFRRLWKDIGLNEIIKSEIQVETDFDIGEALFNMTLNRLSAPSSKRNMEKWQQGIFGINNYDVHQYYRAMDYMIQAKNEIEKRLFDKIADLFSLEVDVVLFDTTSLVYYGDGDKGEDLLAKGFSKARRGDLKQIVIGLIMSKDGYPLGHEVFSGNTNDRTCFKEIIKKVALKFNLGKVILVGDRGMISQKNIDVLEQYGYEYILGYRMRTIPQQDRAYLFSKAGLKIVNKDKLHWKQVSYNGGTLYFCYNPERAKLDASKREETLSKLAKTLQSAEDVKVAITKKEYKQFLNISGKKPSIDEEKIKRDELYDGVYVLTSNTHLSGPDIIESYKNLWQIEAAFKQLKSEIDVGPVYHWKDRRIRAHVMICFLSLLLRTILNKKLKKKYKDASYQDSLKDLKELRAVHLRIHNNDITIRTEYQPGAAQAVKALGMRNPPRILSSKSKNNNQIIV